MTKSDWYEFYVLNQSRQARYYVIQVIDEGGFGKVWSGITGTGIPVAIKIIKPSSNYLRDYTSWYTEQDICLKCLNHAHIITTYDQFCSKDGKLIIVMEKAGGNLKELVHNRKYFDPTAVCSIGTNILSALDYIHGLGVIHRDVTLKNILWFPDGNFKLADFGISKEGVSIEEFAKTFIGHKTYIPPELLLTGYTSRQSDIYQLGLVLLTLLTGHYPIPIDATVEKTRTMILEGTPRQIAELLINKYGRLAEILSIMLRRRDKWRYKTALAVWDDLYKEFTRQKKLKEIAEWLKNQPNPDLPPWISSK
jgi:serine/threonine protein kinase